MITAPDTIANGHLSVMKSSTIGLVSGFFTGQGQG